MSEYIAVIGGANIDIGGKPFKELIPEDSNPGVINISYGGVGRNIAHNLARLGAAPVLLTVSGGDFLGHELLNYCRSEGINTDHVRIDDNEKSSMYLFIADENGDMKSAIAHMRTEVTLTTEYIDSVADVINGARAVVVDCNISQEAFIHIMNICRVPVYVDTVSANKTHKIKGHLSGIDTIKPNRIEAEILTGMTINSEADYSAAADNIISQGVRRVFITMGSKGIIATDKDNSYMISPYETETVNTTGAGDSATAAVVWSSTILKDRFESSGRSFNDLVIPSLAANSAASITIESKDTISDKLTAASILEKINNNKVYINKIR